MSAGAYGGTGAATAIGAWNNLNSRGANMPSAGTLNLDNATGANLHMTGNVTITAVTLAEGAVREVIADGAALLTAPANLIVNGRTATNYETTAGDLLTFMGDAEQAAGLTRAPASS